MNYKEFQKLQIGNKAIKDILELWDKIKSNYFAEKTPIYLEYLVYRLILNIIGINDNKKIISNMKFDSNFSPPAK